MTLYCVEHDNAVTGVEDYSNSELSKSSHTSPSRASYGAFLWGVANPVGFINAFWVRIRDIYKQNWNASLKNSPRARFFRSVVNEHQFYNQLDMLDKGSHRIALDRLMASSHRLGVETGRWARPIVPYEQRLCENCQKLDDEYHFLLECTKLSELRKKAPHDTSIWDPPCSNGCSC